MSTVDTVEAGRAGDRHRLPVGSHDASHLLQNIQEAHVALNAVAAGEVGDGDGPGGDGGGGKEV